MTGRSVGNISCMVAKVQVDTGHDMSALSGERQQLPLAARGSPDIVMFRSVTDWSLWDKAMLEAVDIMGAPNILGSGPVRKKTGEEVPPQSEPNRKRARRTWQPSSQEFEAPDDGAGQAHDPYPMRQLNSVPSGAQEGSIEWCIWAQREQDIDCFLEQARMHWAARRVRFGSSAAGNCVSVVFVNLRLAR